MSFPSPTWLRGWWRPAVARTTLSPSLAGLRGALRAVVRLGNAVEMAHWPGADQPAAHTVHDDSLRGALREAETELTRSMTVALAGELCAAALEHDIIDPLLRSEVILTHTARAAVGKAMHAARTGPA